MSGFRVFMLVAIGMFGSACTAVNVPPPVTSFDSFAEASVTPVAVPRAGRPPAAERIQTPYTIRNVSVYVSPTLSVSEANTLLPQAQIVWRGDPPGDRHQQVAAIFETAMLRAAQTINGPQPADLLINVRRFHALSERAKYTFGGIHSILFDMALVAPGSGATLQPWRTIAADLDGLGGEAALAADRDGRTEKIQITDHLVRVLQEELSLPGGYEHEVIKPLVQQMNRF